MCSQEGRHIRTSRRIKAAAFYSTLWYWQEEEEIRTVNAVSNSCWSYCVVLCSTGSSLQSSKMPFYLSIFLSGNPVSLMPVEEAAALTKVIYKPLVCDCSEPTVFGARRHPFYCSIARELPTNWLINRKLCSWYIYYTSIRVWSPSNCWQDKIPILIFLVKIFTSMAFIWNCLYGTPLDKKNSIVSVRYHTTTHKS